MASVVAALIGAFLGWALGRFTKVIEFRFEVFMRAIDAYNAAQQAAQCVLDRMTAQEDLTGAVTQLDDRTTDMVSLTPVIELVFGEGGDRWLRIIQVLNTIGQQDKEHGHQSVLEATQVWWDFTKVAERKCALNPLRRWRPKVLEALTAGKWRDDFKGGGR